MTQNTYINEWKTREEKRYKRGVLSANNLLYGSLIARHQPLPPITMIILFNQTVLKCVW